MKKKYIFYLVVLAMLMGGQFLVGQQAGLAADINDTIDKQITGLKETTLPSDDPLDLVANLTRGLLGVLALVFLILVIYGGAKWMMSAGNSTTIEDAKKIIVNALIGLLVIGFAFAITQFVFSVILKG